MNATYTNPERLALSVAVFLLAAIAVFGIVHVAPNRHLFPANEIHATLGLYWAALLLLAGVWLVARGRRQMRDDVSHYARLKEVLESEVSPMLELQRHLAGALSVMLRHPQLTVDAGTLKLLARRPKPVRDEKGRWSRVQ